MRALSGTRPVISVLILALVLTLSSAGSSAANAEAAAASPAPASTQGHDADKKKSGGLDFLQLERYDLGIFTLIVFGLLMLVLAKFAWPKITEGLAKREAAIHGARDEAQKAQKDAEDLRLRLQKDYAEAQEKIRAMIEEARRDADQLRANEREAGAKEFAAERERTKREIETAKDAALADIYRQAVDLATTLSSKTLARQISADDHRRLLDESLAELKQVAKSA